MRYVSGLDSVSFQLNYRADLHFLFRCFPRKKLFFSFFLSPFFFFSPPCPLHSKSLGEKYSHKASRSDPGNHAQLLIGVTVWAPGASATAPGSVSRARLRPVVGCSERPSRPGEGPARGRRLCGAGGGDATGHWLRDREGTNAFASGIRGFALATPAPDGTGDSQRARPGRGGAARARPLSARSRGRLARRRVLAGGPGPSPPPPGRVSLFPRRPRRK